MPLPDKFSFAIYINNLASLLLFPLLLSVLEINKFSEHLVTYSSFSLPEVSFKSCGTETLFDSEMWSQSRFTILQVSEAGNKNCNTVDNLHGVEINVLYSSPNIVRVIKSRRVRWAGHVARMCEERGGV